MGPRQVKKAEIIEEFFCQKAILPYGLKVQEVRSAVEEVYGLMHKLNGFLLQNGYERIEELVLGNSLSGFLSEILVKKIADNSRTMERNRMVGGHPDLIPRGKYPDDKILHGAEGIEVKTSKQAGGWQGHNPEVCWLVIFRYTLDETERNSWEKEPITFVQILTAKLQEEDWSFSGRKGASRRTITASIKGSGMHKLRMNPIYQHPDYIIAPTKKLCEEYASILLPIK